MTTYKTFSNRNRPRPEKLIYDAVPAVLREHSARIIRESVGRNANLLDAMDTLLQRENPAPTFTRAPVLSLDGRPPRYVERFWETAIKEGDFFEAMDVIEVGAHFINTARRTEARKGSVTVDLDNVIDELNGRFVEAGVGYQFSKEQDRFVRVDSAFMHAEVTVPATALLTEKGFEGAAQEFQKAHEHWRHMVQDPEAGKDAIAWAVKAVESTAKAIMDARSWPYEKGDTIKRLMEKAFANGLVPADLDSYFCGLRSALTSGLPTIGNRQARHGQGATPKPIEEHMVALGMHLAAATIRFLVEAHKATGTTA